jgi:hypothetical protein
VALLIISSAAVAQVNAPKPRLALGAPAPEIAGTTLEGKPTSLAGLRAANPSKTLILQFASLTDPVFRSHLPSVESLADKTRDQAAFVIVYQKEAHPADADPLELNVNGGFNLAEPTSLAERQMLAQQAVQRLHIVQQTVLVDAWNNTSSLRYGSFPNMTFIIDSAGILQAGYPFMDPAKVQAALDTLAAGKPLPPELKGTLQQSGPALFDFAAAAAEMTGGRGPASIAAVLERATLTDPQKQTLLVAVAEYMAHVQDFRQAFAALPGTPARGTATTPARGTVPAGVGTAATKPTTPQDVQAAQSLLRTSADHLKTVAKQNLNPADAAALFSALDALAPAQRLFTNP